MKQKLKEFLWIATFNLPSSFSVYVLATLFFNDKQSIFLGCLYFILAILITKNVSDTKKLQDELSKTREDFTWLKEQLEKINKKS